MAVPTTETVERPTPADGLSSVRQTRTGIQRCVAALAVGLLLPVAGCSDPTPPKPPSVTKSDPPTAAAAADSVTGGGATGSPQDDTAIPAVGEVRPSNNDATVTPDPTAKTQVATGRTRLADDRPLVNELRLEQHGIRRCVSRRLILLTDLPIDQVADLPPLADRLFEKLEQHFGPLPAAIDGSEFQVTGHLIVDADRFRAAGLMPSSAFTFQHGRHLNYQFWMFNPMEDYYRRHLLLHEFTHCFMTCECGMQDIPPLWYVEGMAEYFATHRLSPGGDDSAPPEFGVLPDTFAGFEGWGRISELRRTFQPLAGSPLEPLTIPSLNEVMPLTVTSFDQDAQYAQAWAICWLINSHPHYQKAFQSLRALRFRGEFNREAAILRDAEIDRLRVDWILFCEAVEEGYDVQHSLPVHAQTQISAAEIEAGRSASMRLQAELGWQDTGLRLTQKESVHVACSGRFSVNDLPQPWISEPQGVSIEYVRGKPLGQIVAVFVRDGGESVSKRISIGRGGAITAPWDSSLWLQVNDRCGSRSNNSGTIDVQLTSGTQHP